ncbi:glycosyltransferase family 4 protein [Desulfonatronospira sp.]|uniref:glycosyltransferase family 4 protein n=1 Tax=Desulfonatronospira sp. TaxID=1962951 RepID=UPI0025BCFB1E|nr:glycosyltransferase family 4 protein [Desulfonatronospira sp.]
MNQRVHESKILRSTFSINSICISYMQSRADMGKLKLSKLFVFMYTIKKLIIELWNFRPAIIYFQISPHGLAFARDFVFVCLMKLFNIPIVFHLRGKGIRNKSKLSKLFYKFCFCNEYVICLSSLLTYDIEDVYKGKPFVVSNGIPDSSFIGSKALLSNNIPKILFLSNLIISKGILDFLEALKIINDKKFKFEGIIVGAEADLNSYKLNNTLKSKGLREKIQYLGPKYNDEKCRIYHDSDIFVFPTKMSWECFPGVILEAMQFNLPVVSTREGAISEIVDDEVTGFIVEKSSPQQLAEKIEILIKNPQLRQQMGQAGRKKYEEKYTLQHFEENMKNVFQEILEDINIKKQSKT